MEHSQGRTEWKHKNIEILAKHTSDMEVNDQISREIFLSAYFFLQYLVI